jgi:hypothetical protein
MMPALLLVMLAATEPKAALAQHLSFVLKVSEPARVADELVARGEKLGGYFSQRTDTTLVLRVPSRDVAQLTPFIEQSGVVVTQQQQARDLGPELLQKRTVLASRQRVLDRYLEVLDTANAAAVVTVEHEINALVQEIEQLSGALRLLEHQLQLAEVRLDFQFPDRRPPIRQGQSSFAWLNSVDLMTLIGAFAHASP